MVALTIGLLSHQTEHRICLELSKVTADSSSVKNEENKSIENEKVQELILVFLAI